jgi:DNA-binding NarL/FixJ family response regulator
VADEEKERRAACVSILAGEKGIRVVAQAGTASETLDAARLTPRILLIDDRLAVGPNVVLVAIFRLRSPETKVIVLTGRSSRAALLEALEKGACGYLNRRHLRTFLAKMVRKVDEGQAWVPRTILSGIIETLARHAIPGNAAASSHQ